jgi:hypothetical protein
MVRRAQMTQLRQIFRDVATSAPVVFSAGNAIWSWVTAEPAGIALNIGVLALATAAQIRDTLTQKKTGLSFFVTSAVHALSALSTLYNGANHLGVSNLFNVLSNDDARRYVFTAAGRAGWAAAHFIMGYRERFGREPAVLRNQPIHAGYADLAMTAADTATPVNPVALALVSAGLFRAFRDDKKEPPETTTLRAFLSKHITPNRLYASTFLYGALIALDKPVYAAAQAVWGYGYGLMDQKRNEEIKKDLKLLKSSPA